MLNPGIRITNNIFIGLTIQTYVRQKTFRQANGVFGSDQGSSASTTNDGGYGAFNSATPTIIGNTSNAQFNICDCSAEISEPNHHFIKIYPSPVSDFLHVVNSLNADAGITLYNAIGQAIHTSFIEANSRNAINISGYPKGLLYITILTPEMKITKKVMVVD